MTVRGYESGDRQLTIDENGTVDFILQGNSLARFGDGEINLLHGEDAKLQSFNHALHDELHDIIPGQKCPTAIPHNMGKRKKYWTRYLGVYDYFFNPDYEYFSSFISRPDEAEIDTPEYWDKIRLIWKGQDIVLVASGDSLTKDTLVGARKVKVIDIPGRDAYGEIDRIEKAIGSPELAILCTGATATCLAARLNEKGVWAVDLGYTGRWLND